MVLFADRSARADLVTFDELTTWTATGPTGSYFNGNSGIGPNTNGWSSGGVFFGNSFNTSPWGDFWNGFAYSNVNAPTTPGFENQYAANQPTGVGGGGNYAVAYSGSQAFWNMQRPSVLQSVYLTNTAYTMYSILDGDQFAKKFGGASGDDPDFFSVRFEGFDSLGGSGSSTGFVDFFLADYRFDDNSLDYVVRDWTQVDLSSLGAVQSVRLTFNSSDISVFNGVEFINTPTYVAIDNLAISAVPEPSSWLLAVVVAGGMMARRVRLHGKGV